MQWPMRHPNNNRLYEEVGGNFGNKRNGLDFMKQGILGNFPEARQADWVIHPRDHLEDFRKDLNRSCALTYKALPSFQYCNRHSCTAKVWSLSHVKFTELFYLERSLSNVINSLISPTAIKENDLPCLQHFNVYLHNFSLKKVCRSTGEALMKTISSLMLWRWAEEHRESWICSLAGLFWAVDLGHILGTILNRIKMFSELGKSIKGVNTSQLTEKCLLRRLVNVLIQKEETLICLRICTSWISVAWAQTDLARLWYPRNFTYGSSNFGWFAPKSTILAFETWQRATLQTMTVSNVGQVDRLAHRIQTLMYWNRRSDSGLKNLQ